VTEQELEDEYQASLLAEPRTHSHERECRIFLDFGDDEAVAQGKIGITFLAQGASRKRFC